LQALLETVKRKIVRYRENRCGMAVKFQLTGGHLALDFANTLDFRYDPERVIELLPTYESFLEFCRQSGIITTGQMRKLRRNTSESDARRTLNRAIELRETLYLLFLSAVKGRRVRGDYLRAFNRFLEDARVPEAVAWQKGALVRTHGDLAEAPDGPLWPVIEAAANLLTSPDCRHVRECSDNTCRWLFLDRSKNHSRRWCEMRICGNRAKAQRFYARSRRSSSSS
jgi:predicted RNA-binding Zn ribbon-like protein